MNPVQICPDRFESFLLTEKPVVRHVESSEAESRRKHHPRSERRLADQRQMPQDAHNLLPTRAFEAVGGRVAEPSEKGYKRRAVPGLTNVTSATAQRITTGVRQVGAWDVAWDVGPPDVGRV